MERVRKAYKFSSIANTNRISICSIPTSIGTRVRISRTPPPYRGHEEVAALMADWFAGAFDDLQVDVEDLIDGGDRVVAVLRMHGRLRREQPRGGDGQTHVLTLRDGKATEIHEYQTTAEALKAVGLTR